LLISVIRERVDSSSRAYG